MKSPPLTVFHLCLFSIVDIIEFVFPAPFVGVPKHLFPRTLLEMDPTLRQIRALERLDAPFRMRHHR